MTTVAVAAWGLAGCSSGADNAALDSYIESERELTEASGDVGVTFSEITIEPEYPSTVVVTYTYLEEIDPAEGAEYFEVLEPQFEEECENYVFPSMREAGVEGELSAKFAYAAPDGEVFWTFSCSSE